MTAFYNEIDPYAAQWLRNLIDAGHIAPGVVDERSIEDIAPNELVGYTQCHFFAGIGGWSLALRLAGWPDSRPVWTGSCPCQPFSAAGKGAGFDDERHLWPAWQHLIAQCGPPIVFGEQVASKAAEPWIDLVHADMEGLGYAFGCIPFPAAGVGAPHIRDRNYWVAHADGGAGGQGSAHVRGRAHGSHAKSRAGFGGGGVLSGLADTDGRHASAEREQRGGQYGQQPQDRGAGRMADSTSTGRRSERAHSDATHSLKAVPARQEESGRRGAAYGTRPGPTNGLWRDADWLLCTDGKWRAVEPGTQQMVDGVSRGMGLLRADRIAKEEMNHATEAAGLADQVLRALRSGHGAQAVWGSLGGCVGLPEATLLLASLCQQSRELGRFFDRATAGGAPGGEGIVRAVRQGAPEAACASPGRGCTEQLAWELGDTLPELSQACPSARQHLDQLRQFTGSPLAHGVSGRVGRLRAYGNAIVSQQAAEFVEAFAEAVGLNKAKEIAA